MDEMKVWVYYELFRLCLSLAAKFRAVAMKADPRPADRPKDEFPFDNDEQIAWDEKYRVKIY